MPAPFEKLYSAFDAEVKMFLQTRPATTSKEVENWLVGAVGHLALRAAEIFERNILREKYGLDLEAQLKEEDGGLIPLKEEARLRIGPCEVCGEWRAVQLCHIIPRREGGSDHPRNYLKLCAIHHHLFDRHTLHPAEWAMLSWEERPENVRTYALSVRLERHKLNWKHGPKTEISQDCECGGDRFTYRFSEDDPSENRRPGFVSRVATCENCGREYLLLKVKDMEYEWWQAWLAARYSGQERKT